MQQVQDGKLDIPLSSNILYLILGDPEVFLHQMGYIFPPACSGSALDVDVAVNLQREAT